MAKEEVELDYDGLMQRALRTFVRDVLNLVADLGEAPGEHHFYIEFLTGAPGVSIPDHLKDQYPERMTIVLQHQFDALTITDEGFSVTLWFKGVEARLQIPFDAVTNFADPSVQFGLRFDDGQGGTPADITAAAPLDQDDAADDAASPNAEKDTDDSAAKSNAEASKSDGADIVSLDAFRKK